MSRSQARADDDQPDATPDGPSSSETSSETSKGTGSETSDGAGSETSDGSGGAPDPQPESKSDAQATKAAKAEATNERAEKRAAKRSSGKDDSKSDKKSRLQGAGVVAQVRTRVAQLVWLLFVVFALFLAVGALMVALDANNQNALVGFVLDGADAVDLDIFSRKDGIKEFKGDGADVKNALLNWGLGAVAYLVVGRILDRLIRP